MLKKTKRSKRQETGQRHEEKGKTRKEEKQCKNIVLRKSQQKLGAG